MHFIFPLISFIGTALALWTGRKVALATGFTDQPGGRKTHDIAVPPIGGLAVIPAFLLVSHFAGLSQIVPWPLAAGLVMLLVMGAIDDKFTINPLVKFAIMVWTSCFVVIFGEAQIGQLGNLFGFGLVELGLFSKAFTVMCLVLLMNAINMLDGVDGLAGGFCALVVFWMMVVCGAAHDPQPFLALAILLAALLGFLLFNMRGPHRARASVFLGDSGSLCLGLLLGWFSIRLTQGTGAPIAPITVIWIIGLPVMDAFALFIARSAIGLHPFNADRRHLHHRFLDSGISPGKTTSIILCLIMVMALVGFMAQACHLPPVILFALWMILFITHTVCIMHPKGYSRLAARFRLPS